MMGVISQYGSYIAMVVGLLTLAFMLRQNGITAGRMEKSSEINTERLNSHSNSIDRIEVIVLRLETLPELMRKRDVSIQSRIDKIFVILGNGRSINGQGK